MDYTIIVKYFTAHNIVKYRDMFSVPCLQCKPCNICIHTFMRTCTANIIKMNIWKYIHAYARKLYKISTKVFCEDSNSNKQDILLKIPVQSITSLHKNDKNVSI